MSYQPKTVATKYATGPTGLAKVQINEKAKKTKISFKGGKSYILSLSDCPDVIREGVWYVTLSGDEKKVFGIRPVSGVFTGKVEKFSAREGEQPAPKTHVGKDWSYQFFTVILQITKGKCKGMSVPVLPRYHFTEAEEDGKSVVAFSHPKSKYTPFLIKFCDVTGMWNSGLMLYKDNILPTMQKRILHEEKEFDFVMEDGWVTNFITKAEDLESEDLPDEAPWGNDDPDEAGTAEDKLADEDGME